MVYIYCHSCNTVTTPQTYILLTNYNYIIYIYLFIYLCSYVGPFFCDSLRFSHCNKLYHAVTASITAKKRYTLLD